MIPEDIYRVSKEFINSIPAKDLKDIVYDVNGVYAIDCWVEPENNYCFAVLYNTYDIMSWKLLKREKING
jgi:hypothetical protein